MIPTSTLLKTLLYSYDNNIILNKNAINMIEKKSFFSFSNINNSEDMVFSTYFFFLRVRTICFLYCFLSIIYINPELVHLAYY